MTQAGQAPDPHAGVIELKLHDVAQLFNSMDPSPFIEKDLDEDAEAFIEGWAQEFPLRQPLTLVVHLPAPPDGADPQPLIETAVQNYFDRKAVETRRQWRQLMQRGRWSLVVGVLFLGCCLALAQTVAPHLHGAFRELVQESLLIGGWVAMWRPLEIYLYEWWPLLRDLRACRKLSNMPVEVRYGS